VLPLRVHLCRGPCTDWVSGLDPPFRPCDRCDLLTWSSGPGATAHARQLTHITVQLPQKSSPVAMPCTSSQDLQQPFACALLAVSAESTNVRCKLTYTQAAASIPCATGLTAADALLSPRWQGCGGTMIIATHRPLQTSIPVVTQDSGHAILYLMPSGTACETDLQSP
jgi:hypothetical protein